MARPESWKVPREMFFCSNVKYECESNRNVRSATNIKNLLCMAVGTADRQNGEEAYAKYGWFQNTLKNYKGDISSCKNCLSFSFDSYVRCRPTKSRKNYIFRG
jgi:hypothetical protein